MIWVIIAAAAIWGLHHVVKYLLPTFRILDEAEREEFHRGGGL